MPVIVFVVGPARSAARKSRDDKDERERARDDDTQEEIPVLGQQDPETSCHHQTEREQSGPVHAEMNTKPDRTVQ